MTFLVAAFRSPRFPHDPSPSLSIKTRKDTPKPSWGNKTPVSFGAVSVSRSSYLLALAWAATGWWSKRVWPPITIRSGSYVHMYSTQRCRRRLRPREQYPLTRHLDEVHLQSEPLDIRTSPGTSLPRGVRPADQSTCPNGMGRSSFSPTSTAAVRHN